jgi:hypothetical protein
VLQLRHAFADDGSARREWCLGYEADEAGSARGKIAFAGRPREPRALHARRAEPAIGHADSFFLVRLCRACVRLQDAASHQPRHHRGAATGREKRRRGRTRQRRSRVLSSIRSASLQPTTERQCSARGQLGRAPAGALCERKTGSTRTRVWILGFAAALTMGTLSVRRRRRRAVPPRSTSAVADYYSRTQ